MGVLRVFDVQSFQATSLAQQNLPNTAFLRNNIFKSTPEIMIGCLDPWKLTLNSSYNAENRIKPTSD
jgi:hypothetical protein